MSATIRTLPRRGFNTHDATYRPDGSRHTVIIDMSRRHGLVVNALGRKKAGFNSADEVAAHLNTRFKSDSYTGRDIIHSLRVLTKAGIVEYTGGVWKLAPRGQNKWQNTTVVKLNKP